MLDLLVSYSSLPPNLVFVSYFVTQAYSFSQYFLMTFVIFMNVADEKNGVPIGPRVITA